MTARGAASCTTPRPRTGRPGTADRSRRPRPPRPAHRGAARASAAASRGSFSTQVRWGTRLGEHVGGESGPGSHLEHVRAQVDAREHPGQQALADGAAPGARSAVPTMEWCSCRGSFADQPATFFAYPVNRCRIYAKRRRHPAVPRALARPLDRARGRVRAGRRIPRPPAPVRAADLRVERRHDRDHRARHLGGAARARGLGSRARRSRDPHDRTRIDAHAVLLRRARTARRSARAPWFRCRRCCARASCARSGSRSRTPSTGSRRGWWR